MPAKPHRYVIDRVSGYADEASAYLRRRRADREPFARVAHADGTSASYGSDQEAGRELFRAAAKLIEAAR